MFYAYYIVLFVFEKPIYAKSIVDYLQNTNNSKKICYRQHKQTTLFHLYLQKITNLSIVFGSIFFF